MDVYAAIADPVRREILSLLARGPAAAGVVAAAFTGISRPAVSRHLRVLREAGLVASETSGRQQVYTASISPLREVSSWIDTLAPGFGNHLDALDTEVDRTRRERTTVVSRIASTTTNEEHTA